MAKSAELSELQSICTQIDTLQSELNTLGNELKFFKTITGKIETVYSPFPGTIVNDLNTFYSGLQEVDDMIQELDQITLAKLDVILRGASKGIEQLIAPIPGILSDITTVSDLFPRIQSKISGLMDPSKGLDSSLNTLRAKLASWSNTTPQSGGNKVGTGVLNAVQLEMRRAIADNKTLNNRYDAEINSIVGQLNELAETLRDPVTQLTTDSGEFDNQLKQVNAYLETYYEALNSVSALAEKVDQVVALLDRFKPNVDLVYGIVQPLGWFVELMESKSRSRPTELTLEFDISAREHRIAHYADTEAAVESKFQVFEQTVYAFFENNNIGDKIQQAVEHLLPIHELKTAADDLLNDLQNLDTNRSVATLLATFTSIRTEIETVEKTLQTLSTDAARATGSVTFSRTHPSTQVTLAKGTRVKSTDGDLIFVTAEDAVFHKNSFTSDAVNATAQAVGSAGNVTENAITVFIDTPVRQPDGTYQREPNPVYDDTISIGNSTSFSGGTDISVSQIQGEANDLANKMLPALI